jgi:hypothetical protein
MSTDVSEERAASTIRAMIAGMMEAARTSETGVDIQLRTRQHIPEDSDYRRSFNLIASEFTNWATHVQIKFFLLLFCRIQ